MDCRVRLRLEEQVRVCMNNLASVLAAEPKASELYSSAAGELARMECRAKLQEHVDHIRAHKCKGHAAQP